MDAAKKVVGWICFVCVGLVAALVVLGGLKERPTLVSYATSDSMAPTIGVGDLFFIIPSNLAPAEVGDIIVFQSAQPNPTVPYLVHRAVGSGDDGFLTHGDHNPFLDQDGAEPPVTADRIAGKVVTWHSAPVLLPNIGTYVKSFSDYVQQHFLTVAAAFGAVFLLTLALEKGDRQRNHLTSPWRWIDTRPVVLLALLVLPLSASVTTVLSEQLIKVDYLVTTLGPEVDGVLLPGHVAERSLVLTNSGLVPFFAFVDSSDANVSFARSHVLIWPRQTQEIKARVAAGDKTGLFHRYIRVRNYLPLLPPTTIRLLQDIRPSFPIMALALELLVPVFLYILMTGAVRRVRVVDKQAVRQLRAAGRLG